MQSGSGVQPEVPKQQSVETPGRDISSVEADSLAYEQSPERKDDILHAEKKTEFQAAKEAYAEPPSDDGAATTNEPVVSKDNITIEVEKILEDGVGQFYASLPDDAKPVFKKKGEEAVTEIAKMVSTLKVRMRRLISLISNWLKTVPGVNKHFLEQEAKIKADRIVELIEARKQDQL